MTHDHPHELPFWRKYIFSTDHKMIAKQYLLTGLIMALARLNLPSLYL